MSLKLHCLKVRTGIRLRKIHGSSGTLVETWQKVIPDLIGGELKNRLPAVLQTPYVGKTGIGPGDQLGSHDVRHHREVQSVIFAREIHPDNPGTGQSLMILPGSAGINDMTVSDSRPFMIDILCIGGDHLGTDGPDDLQHPVIVVHGILKIMRCIIILIPVPVIHLLQPDDLFHRRVCKVEPQVTVVGIEICHWCGYFLLRLVLIYLALAL